MITEADPSSVQPSQAFAENPKNFTTRLLPDSAETTVGALAGELASGTTGAHGAPNTAPACATTPTLADLGVLYGGRDRLLRVGEVAEQLGISRATVYAICKNGHLPHIWIVDSIRVRPEEYSISNVGLAKICTRSGIPTPPRGYWALLEAGRAPPRPRPPTAKDAPTIRLMVRAAVASEEKDELSVRLEEERSPEHRIAVPDRLLAPSELVQSARAALQGAKTDSIARFWTLVRSVQNGLAEPFRQSRRLTLKRTGEKPIRGIVEMPIRRILWAQVPPATTDARPG